jgi:hypothetical protein
MSVRAAAGAVVAGAAASLALAGPAFADPVDVRLGLPDGFTAGGSPGSVSVQIARDDLKRCVSVAATLAVELDDLQPGQLQVAVGGAGRWQPVSLTEQGDGRFITPPLTPDPARVCRDRNHATSLHFLVAFPAGTQAGEVKLEATAWSRDDKLGDDSNTTNLAAGPRATASPTPSPSVTPSSTPSAAQSVIAAATASAPVDGATAALAGPAPATPISRAGDGGGLSAAAMVMILGGVTAGGGIALLLVMIRRIRGGESDSEAVNEERPWRPFEAGSVQPAVGNGPGLSAGGYGPAWPGLADTAELLRLGAERAAVAADDEPTQILPVIPP